MVLKTNYRLMQVKFAKLFTFIKLPVVIKTSGLVFFVRPFLSRFDFTTAAHWDCVAAVERLPALHNGVDFIFLSFGSWVALWNLATI